MNLKKIVTSGIAILSLVGLLACKGNNETTSTAITTDEIEHVDEKHNLIVDEKHELELKPNLPKFSFFQDGIYANLKKAGISTVIKVDAKDKGLNTGIKEIILYEDGKQIKSKKFSGYRISEWGYGNFTIAHKTEGTHEYYAEAIDKDDNKIKSKTISIKFSGKFTDLPPELFLRTYSLDDNGDIDITASDKGDNKGIEEMILYENNQEIKRFKIKNKEYSKNYYSLKDRALELGLSGKYVYHATAVDIGGNKTRSKVISVNYKRK